jgi:hypothetical protein
MILSSNSSIAVNPNHIVQRSVEKKPEEKKSALAVRVADAVANISFFMIFLGLPLFFTGITFQGIAFEKQVYFYVWILLALVAWA